MHRVMIKWISQCTVVALLIASVGCASIGARSDEVYPPGSVYPGVRWYASDVASFIRNDPNDPNNTTEFGRKDDAWVAFLLFPFWGPDLLVLTPITDTILLPFDLYRKFTAQQLDENIQQPPAR